MSFESIVLGRMVGGVSSIVRFFATWANIIGTLVVLALVAVVNTDMIGRGFFAAPFLGAVEVVQFSMVLIVFMQLPDVVRVNRLTRSDGFLLLLGDKRPALSSALRRAIDFLSSLFMLLVSIAIWPEFVDAWETGDFFGVPGVFTAPYWPLKLTIFASTALCTLLFLLKAFLPFSMMAVDRAPKIGARMSHDSD